MLWLLNSYVMHWCSHSIFAKAEASGSLMEFSVFLITWLHAHSPGAAYLCCLNKSRAKPTFWHCVWHWKYIIFMFLCNAHCCIQRWSTGDKWWRGWFVGRKMKRSTIKVILCCSFPKKWFVRIAVISRRPRPILWFQSLTSPSRRDLTVKNEMSFVFYHLTFFFFLKKIQIRSQWQVCDNGITFYGGSLLASHHF